LSGAVLGTRHGRQSDFPAAAVHSLFRAPGRAEG
jgi:hypothetical protein